MSEPDRAALRDALLAVAPWLDDVHVGPRAVDAGPCDRCGGPPRLVPTCGPNAAALCRDCLVEVDEDGWCEGHRAVGQDARAWAARLPGRWADLVVLWWVSTGELRMPRLGPDVIGDLPPAVRRVLPPIGADV